MIDADKLVDKFSGFITKEQAEQILKGEISSSAMPQKETSRSTVNVKELLYEMKTSADVNKKLLEMTQKSEQVVNVKDKIYRIFNSVSVPINGKDVERRSVILGDEGSTIRLNLKGNICNLIDINSFERGDMVSVNNAIVDPLRAELKSGPNTLINKISPSRHPFIYDFSSIKEGLRKVDIAGRIIEIGSIRHVNILGATAQIAVASCVVSDGKINLEASLWGSSAIKTANMKTNDFVKMEFCDIKARDGKFQIYANDISRVVTGNYFASKVPRN